MDAHGEHDDLTEEGDQGAYQERATAMLDLIAQRTKLALSEAGIDIVIFFLVSQNSNAILTFGTPTDPPDDLWASVGEIVSCVVRNSLGIERTRCRGLVCASTHTVVAAGHASDAHCTPATPVPCLPIRGKLKIRVKTGHNGIWGLFSF
jgi:hypothetical protein